MRAKVSRSEVGSCLRSLINELLVVVLFATDQIPNCIVGTCLHNIGSICKTKK